jgi:subtilisin family serine protease
VDITSVGITDPEASAMSGTSMATPHVAGDVALYLADHPDSTPAEVTQALVTASMSDKVGHPGDGSRNKLLFVGACAKTFGLFPSDHSSLPRVDPS